MCPQLFLKQKNRHEIFNINRVQVLFDEVYGSRISWNPTTTRFAYFIVIGGEWNKLTNSKILGERIHLVIRSFTLTIDWLCPNPTTTVPNFYLQSLKKLQVCRVRSLLLVKFQQNLERQSCFPVWGWQSRSEGAQDIPTLKFRKLGHL
jgi:hypothetical protein